MAAEIRGGWTKLETRCYLMRSTPQSERCSRTASAAAMPAMQMTQPLPVYKTTVACETYEKELREELHDYSIRLTYLVEVVVGKHQCPDVAYNDDETFRPSDILHAVL